MASSFEELMLFHYLFCLLEDHQHQPRDNPLIDAPSCRDSGLLTPLPAAATRTTTQKASGGAGSAGVRHYFFIS
jgi:hypothetical protein